MLNNTNVSRYLRLLRTKQTGVRVLLLVLFVTVVAFVLFQGTKERVVMVVNGESTELYTHAKTVAELLQDQSITVTEYDELSTSPSTVIVNGMTIKWKQAFEVAISVDGNQSNIWTTEKLVRNILEEANMEVTEHDLVSQSLDTEVGADNKIDIQKAFQLTLVDGQEERQVWSTSTTVANFLKQQGIQLTEFDRVEKNLEEVIAPDEKIAVVRVEKVTDVVEELVDFAVEKKNDSSLLKGTEKVITEGKKGTVTRTYNIIKENGAVTEKKVASEEVVTAPTTQVIAVGTKVVTARVSRSKSEESAGGKVFYVTATAYTPHCAGCSGISAAGLDLRANSDLKVIAVDPDVIPLGTKVWVEGYGNAVAGDTGGAIKGNKIDILVQTKSEAYSWGRKKVRIKVLN